MTENEKVIVVTLEELLKSAGDEVFTFHDPDKNEYVFINATKVRAHCEAHPDDVQRVIMTIRGEDFRHIMANNGIEREKLQRLVLRPDIVAEPVLIANWEDDAGHTVVIDGNHRICVAYMAGCRELKAYTIPRAVWSKYTVDFPQEMGPWASGQGEKK